MVLLLIFESVATRRDKEFEFTGYIHCMGNSEALAIMDLRLKLGKRIYYPELQI